MSNHDRDNEAAWLLAREQGRPGPTIAQSRVERYARLEALFAELPATPVAPLPGWRERTLTALHSAVANAPAGDFSNAGVGPAKPQRRRWIAPLALAALVAALVILFAVDKLSGVGDPGVPQIAMTVLPGAASRGEPSIGDTLVVRASRPGSPELRVYGADGALQASCTEEAGPGCRADRAGGRVTLILEMPIKKRGMLRAVLYASALPASIGINGDMEAARTAGVAATPSAPLTIR
jgi:hypothetical protein